MECHKYLEVLGIHDATEPNLNLLNKIAELHPNGFHYNNLELY